VWGIGTEIKGVEKREQICDNLRAANGQFMSAENEKLKKIDLSKLSDEDRILIPLPADVTITEGCPDDGREELRIADIA
jgi:hypothetical protein